MAQRSNAPRDPKVIRRTLHWFWWVTKKRPFAAFMAVFTSVAYTALLNYANTYVMSRIVDRISAEAVPAAQVFSVFAPYVIHDVPYESLWRKPGKSDFTLHGWLRGTC